MTPEQYQSVKAAFADLVDRPVAARAERLARESTEVRAEVERLLGEVDAPATSAGDLLERGAAAMLAGVTSGEEPGDVEALPATIGPYHVESVLGRGGMGTVYAARQRSPDRRVAVKVVRRGAETPETLARFRREAKVLGQLQHPGIAHVYEAGVANVDGVDRPYFAMELIEGRRVDEHVAEEKLDRDAILELVARIGDAVQHAHQKGIVHRDLKPANVLVSSGGETIDGTMTGSGIAPVGRPVVLDFGVSRFLDDEDRPDATLATQVGAVVGTLGSMAPEQLDPSGAPADTRCDVYALGVLLFELLSGRRPFDLAGLSIAAASRVVEDRDPPRLGSLVPSCRGDVEVVVAKALEKDRERRYATAAELADDLRRCVRDEPIAARPATSLYQLRKFARRNRALVGGVVATFVVLVAGLVAVLVLLGNVARERDATADARRRQQELAEFQSRILFDLDVGSMVDAIRGDLLAQVDERADAGVDPERLARVREQVESLDVAQAAAAAFEASIADRGVRLLDEGYTDDPIVEADLRSLLASVFGIVRRPEDALAQHRRAFDLRRDALGPGDPGTIASLRQVMRYLYGARRVDEALALHDEVVASLAGRFDAGDPRMLQLRYARAAVMPGDPAVIPVLEEIARGYERLGPEHAADRLDVLHQLAIVQAGRGDPHEAFAFWDEHVLPFVKTGRREPPFLRDLKIVADAYAQAGRWSEAADLFGTAYRRERRSHEIASGMLFIIGCSEAMALERAGRLEEADVAFAALEARLATDHGRGSNAWTGQAAQIALASIDCGRYESALRIVDDVLAARVELGFDETDRVRRNVASMRRRILDAAPHLSGRE